MGLLDELFGQEEEADATALAIGLLHEFYDPMNAQQPTFHQNATGAMSGAGEGNQWLRDFSTGVQDNFGAGLLAGGIADLADKTYWGEEPTYGDYVMGAFDVPVNPASIGAKAAIPLMGLLGATKFGIPKKSITVMDPQRAGWPGIYDDPKEVAARAASNTAPESPNLQKVFGVSRDDLYEINKGRVGNQEPNIKQAAKPKGAAAARKVTNPRNTDRLLSVLDEAGKYPELHKGMDSWYEMQPLFDQFKQISDNPVDDFWRFQNFTGMASPGSEVLTELNRGTAALYLDNLGRFGDFEKYGGMAAADRGAFFPDDMRGIMGHPYHSTSQAKPMRKYIEGGILDMDSPKVPLYIQSAGTEETGFQNLLPVGDAHFSRAIGLGDTRTANKGYGASISTPELTTVGPWWRESVAEPLGLSAVQGQGRAWGTFAPATGVDTPVGAPKMELIADKIAEAAKHYGVPIEKARDMILMGSMYAPNLGLLK